MKKLMKDTTQLAMGNIMVGGLGAAGGGSGVAAIGEMMPAIGSITMAKHMVRMSGQAMKPIKKMKF